jgi:hypothetical protein
MLIQTFSDLHGDAFPHKKISIHPDVDAVVVPGDTCQGVRNAFVALRRIVPERIPIVMTAGNHEFYRRAWPAEIKEGRALAPDYNIHFLETSCVKIAGARFAGATLWTDFRMFGLSNQAAAMNAARSGMNDFRVVTWQKNPWKRFRPEEAMLLHDRSRRFLRDVMAEDLPFPLVVAVHHAPITSVADELKSDLLTAAYASDLSEIFEPGDPGSDDPEKPALPRLRPPALFLHGHLHRSCDYIVGATRIVCNAHGYGNENPRFDPCKVIEIG